MILKHHLLANGLSLTEFAEKIDVSVETVRRYVAGERIPGKEIMCRIVKETDDAVLPNDFYGMSSDTEAA